MAEEQEPQAVPQEQAEPKAEVAKEDSKAPESSKGGDEVKKDRKDDRDRKDRDRDDRKDKKEKSSRRSRSRSRDRKRRSRSRSRDKKRRSRSRSDSRSRRKKSRSRSRDRDRKKTSSRRSRSRSRDRRRSRSRDRDSRRARSRSRDRGGDKGRGSSRRSRSRGSGSESDDGLGGYKPRKRQDVPPPIQNGPGTGADPFANYRQKVTAAGFQVTADPQAQMRQWQLQQLQARVMVLEQQAKSAATATSKTQREVYVGGLIPGVVSSEALRTLFNSALAVQFSGMLTAGMDPVINVNMHTEGKYAFVEFRTPDMASAALALSGQVQLMGCNISVARPSGFVDPGKAGVQYAAAKEALSCLERGDLEGVAAAALKGANLQGLGLPPHIADPATANAVVLPPGVAIDGVSAAPTPNLCYLGMVTAPRLKDDQEYADMKEDLVEQCSEYAAGCVTDLKIPRPHDPLLSDQYIGIANFGRIFVRYDSPAHAQLCRDKLHGRMYDGQLVQVFYVSDEAYDKVQ